MFFNIEEEIEWVLLGRCIDGSMIFLNDEENRMDKVEIMLRIFYFIMVLSIGSQTIIAYGVDRVFPGKEWQTKSPAELYVDREHLQAIADYLGGRGFISRKGYQIFTWGEPNHSIHIFSSKPTKPARFPVWASRFQFGSHGLKPLMTSYATKTAPSPGGIWPIKFHAMA